MKHPPNQIFVFGSNAAGRHGRGAARQAMHRYGAEYGIGEGRTGNAYAIPTKGYQLERLPLGAIKGHVRGFLEYAWMHPELSFYVTRVGCGLAGYTEEEIKPLFEEAPENCEFTWLT